MQALLKWLRSLEPIGKIPRIPLSWIKALPLGIGVPLVVLIVSVPPDEITSNVSKWAAKIGIAHLPIWVSNQSFDQQFIVATLAVLFVYACFVYASGRNAIILVASSFIAALAAWILWPSETPDTSPIALSFVWNGIDNFDTQRITLKYSIVNNRLGPIIINDIPLLTVVQIHKYIFPGDTAACFGAHLDSLDLAAAPDREANLDDLGNSRYAVVVWPKIISINGQDTELPQTIARRQSLTVAATYYLDKVDRRKSDN
jgi:hypothetical protein